MGSLIPNMWFQMTSYHPVTWHRACALTILPLKWRIHIAFSHNSATDQDRTIKFGSQHVYVDFYTNLTFKVGPNFEILGPPYNFWTNRAIRFKFGTDIEDGPLLRPDHKTTPKWAWPGSRDQISKFWDPHNFWTNREWYLLQIWQKYRRRTPDDKTTPKWAWPRSRDPISTFWDP